MRVKCKLSYPYFDGKVVYYPLYGGEVVMKAENLGVVWVFF